MSTTADKPRRTGWVALIVFSLLILPPAVYGFGSKFTEFLSMVGHEEGAFTLPAVASYLLSSLGFFFLLLWAVWHGMFRDIEGPKYAMLEQEQRLDAQEGSPPQTEDNHGAQRHPRVPA